jgi:hypothetical protein
MGRNLWSQSNSENWFAGYSRPQEDLLLPQVQGLRRSLITQPRTERQETDFLRARWEAFG